MPQTARARTQTPGTETRQHPHRHSPDPCFPTPPRWQGTDRPGASGRPRQRPGLHAHKERQSGRAVRALELANGSPTGPQPKSSSTAVRAVPPQHHRCQPSRPCSRANCASVAWDAITASSIVLRVQTQMRCKLREVHAGGYGGDRKPPSATFPRFRHQRYVGTDTRWTRAVPPKKAARTCCRRPGQRDGSRNTVSNANTMPRPPRKHLGETPAARR